MRITLSIFSSFAGVSNTLIHSAFLFIQWYEWREDESLQENQSAKFCKKWCTLLFQLAAVWVQIPVLFRSLTAYVESCHVTYQELPTKQYFRRSGGENLFVCQSLSVSIWDRLCYSTWFFQINSFSRRGQYWVFASHIEFMFQWSALVKEQPFFKSQVMTSVALAKNYSIDKMSYSKFVPCLATPLIVVQSSQSKAMGLVFCHCR